MIGIGGSSYMGGPKGLLNAFGDQEEGKIRGSILLRLMHFVAPYKLQLLAAGALMLVTTAGGLLVPFMMRNIIDVQIAGRNFQGLINDGILIIAAMFLSYLASAGQSYILARVGQKVLYGLRNRLFNHLQKLSVAYHDSHIVGVTVSRVINDVAVINNLLSEGLITLFGDSILIIGTVVAMVLMDVKLALITFSIIPLMVAATIVFSRKARVAFRDTREKVGTLVGNLAENIGGMRVIQSYAQEDNSQKRFEANNWRNRNAHVRAMVLSFVFLPTVDILSVAATCIVLLAGGILASGGHVTVGVIVAFMTYVTRFFIPIRELSQLFSTLQSASAGGERVLEILEMKPAVEDRPGAKELREIAGKIEFRNVSFSYKKDIEVLHNINLCIEPGENVAVVGPTGAGKTSIINLVCRFYEATEGEILIDEHNLRDVTLGSIHGHMGFVSQDPFLFPGTIAENICFGADDVDKAAMMNAATHAEAGGFIDNLPDRYDTRVLEGGVNLSTGQRQLISIARALLVDPEILIMDEATSSVDTITEGLIQKALKFLLTERTSIIIAHRLTTVQGADRIYVIDDGRIIETGTHDFLINKGGMYRDLYERQFV